MRKVLLFAAVLMIIAALIGCGAPMQQYQTEFTDTFDTVVSVIGYAQTQQEFADTAQVVYDNFTYMHKLFDIYNDYEGINNIKTINDNAGIAPVEVDPLVIELIVQAKQWHDKTNGVVNIALGPVLKIWHDYRTAGIEDPQNAKLPELNELKQAAQFTDIDKVIVDEKSSTVYIEQGMRLDVGAIAKGFATQVTAQLLEKSGVDNVLISAGGNVKAIGQPADERTKWGVGIKDPKSTLNYSTSEENLLDVAFVADLSVVTSGSYERFYTVNGLTYHHIIDEDTLFPATHYLSVTVVTKDSTIADVLSTALFIMPIEQALAYVEQMEGTEALWVTIGGEIITSPGMTPYLRDLGGAVNQ